MNTHREDADGDMAVDEDYTPTETSLTTDFPPSIQSSSLSLRPHQPPHMRIFPSSNKEVGSSSRRPKPNEMEEYERGHIRRSSSRLHPSQPQSLNRYGASQHG